ncbi:MAG: hypothetical protein IJY74_02060 [Oscillospiraceae bacterium]|nr:hypothetical protein [Oscillospiraceae bacterium]
MKMKTIQNEHYKKLCNVIASYCGDEEKAKGCFAVMKDASYDDENKTSVYEFEPDMEVLKLDDFSQILGAAHHKAIKAKYPEERNLQQHTPSAVDAVCIDENNNWYLIEFKNQKIDSKVLGSVKKKMLSSLWLLFHTFSLNGYGMDDITKFAREMVTYILVCSRDKNRYDARLINQKELLGEHYTPNSLYGYIDYYFKDVYVYTEAELRSFIAKFR